MIESRVVVETPDGPMEGHFALPLRADRVPGVLVAFLAACRTHVSAAVCFYGGGIVTPRPTSNLAPLLSEAGRIRCPVLGLFGEEDASISLTDVAAIRERLSSLGKVSEIATYPGAGHGFSCEERPSYRADAAADAWKRTLDWFGRHLLPAEGSR